MTKDEFIAVYRKTNKQFNLVGIGFLIYFFGVTCVAASLLNFIEKHEVANWVKLVPGIFLFGSLAILAVLVWFVHRKAKTNGLICKNCKKLLGGTLGQVTIASGNCGNCGQSIFDSNNPR